MLLRFTSASRFALLGLLTVCVACAPSAQQPAAETQSNSAESHDHEHEHEHSHERPASLADGVAQIKTHLKTVQDAFANGKPEECDDALHELAVLLEVLPDVASESDLPKESWEEVKKASSGLMDAMMKIHDGFHGGGTGSTYDDVKASVDENLALLESKASSSGNAASTEATTEEESAE